MLRFFSGLLIALAPAAGHAATVSTEIELQPAEAPLGRAVSAAFGDNRYLVVWQDDQAASGSDIYGARLDVSGARIDLAPLLLAIAVGTQRRPVVAATGNTALVVWENDFSGSVDLHGVLVNLESSQPIGRTIMVSTAPGAQHHPALTWNGSSFVVAWEDERGGTGSELFFARVSSGGDVLDPDGIAISTGTATGARKHPSLASDSTASLLVWEEWRAGESDIHGARILSSGAVEPLVNPVCAATNNQITPSVAWSAGGYLVVWEDFRPHVGSGVGDAGANSGGGAGGGSGSSSGGGSGGSSGGGSGSSSGGGSGGGSGSSSGGGSGSSSGGGSGGSSGAGGGRVLPNDIWATRIDVAGGRPDLEELLISAAPETPTPQVSALSNGYLVVWPERTALGWDINGVVLGATGARISALSISTTAVDEFAPAVAGNLRGGALVGYERQSRAPRVQLVNAPEGKFRVECGCGSTARSGGLVALLLVGTLGYLARRRRPARPDSSSDRW